MPASTPRPIAPIWNHASIVFALGLLYFLASYLFTNWYASLLVHVPHIALNVEQRIPFVPWSIVPYLSLDILVPLSFFLCLGPLELKQHTLRLITAQTIAVTCFILFPLEFSFSRPPLDGIPKILFNGLGLFDKHFNQAPSLHIIFTVFMWHFYKHLLVGWQKWLMFCWLCIIGISVLTTFQHHLFDIPTGIFVAYVCLWLWPHIPTPKATADPNTAN